MQRETLHRGLLIKLVTDYSNVPAGTWATVNSTGFANDNVWWFTLRWHPYKPIPGKFPREVIEYSLNLWESDLALFEVVIVEEAQGARRSRPNYRGSSRPRLAQLSLPFGDD